MAAIAIALPTLVFTLADVKSTSVTRWGFIGMAVVSCATRVALTLMMAAVAARILRIRNADVETNAVMLHER